MEASWDTLVTQAHGTADTYFHYARRTLEKSGMKFTAADVIALAQIAARDFHSACTVAAADKQADAVRETSSDLCKTVETATGTVETALETVALALAGKSKD